ncbi:MAG: ribulokinase [Chloroflexi bacterium]|nr:ribulokinase [Chloroflexota bacterium]MCY3581025.1 ribulokinase [Chloroflexota bacterium]MCY3715214.1 ribulokinase [Chloroflexota bacterium]MDE2649985.1 ribulokinase [Chloroflexota bacterium]MXX84249.1 ribulokinase [Chloroflexota bacterium]
MYTIGLDFGTLSGRAVLVDCRDGTEVAESVFDYPHGVMDSQLPSGLKLPPDWALQHPRDYIDVLRHTVPAVLRGSGIDAADVAGIAIDFTASSPMPTTSDGRPLCYLPELVDEPHAYIKLWKHHAAQRQADHINETARQLGESWLPRYGGKISSEWFFSKLLQILQERPDIYAKIDRFVEAADWVIWQMTGTETRNTCTAGYKAMVQDGDFPSRAYFKALDPAFEHVVDEKVGREFAELGDKAGELTVPMADMTGLRAGIAVAVANVDAHVTAPAVKATEPGIMVMVMGTSCCHILSGAQLQVVDGMCGVVQGGIIPGLYGYEAGQSAVGDIFAWYVDHAVPPAYHHAAAAANLDLHSYLEREAAQQAVGQHGLVALDWWNGNRSTLVDVDLTGLMLGMNLATRAPDIYRALIEATAYGTREIIEAFDSQGIAVNELVAAGGLPEKNALLCQIFADVTGRPLKLSGSAQAPALGAAMHAAVAAGIYPDIHAAAEKMGKLKDQVITPIAANQRQYDQLFAEYKTLYDYFGRGANDVMKRLKAIKHAALNQAKP